MTLWDFLHNNPDVWPTVFIPLIICLVFVAAAISFIIYRLNVVWKFYQIAKNEIDLENLMKTIQKILKKRQHSVAFVINEDDNQDNMREFNEFHKMFGTSENIQIINTSSVNHFNTSLRDYKIIVYKVLESEVPKELEEDNKPVYWELAKYCGDNQKNCVLLTGYVPLKGLNNFYVTTVNFYSKLRETLYILLYFTP